MSTRFFDDEGRRVEGAFLARVPVSYMAAGAAVVALANYIPVFPIVGLGATITAGMMVVPLMGVLLGPLHGTLSVAIGTFVAQFIAPYSAIFGPLTFIMPSTCALVAGLVTHNRWERAALLELILLLLWYLTTTIYWNGQPNADLKWYFPFFHIISIGLTVALGSRIPKWIASPSRSQLSIGIFLSSLIGTLAEHLLGNSFFIALYSAPAKLFAVVLLIYPFERTIGALGAMIIGVPLFLSFRKIGMEIGPPVSKN